MRPTLALFATAALVLPAVVLACNKNTPATSPNGAYPSASAYGGYGQPQQGAYPQQGTYPQPSGAYVQPTATPAPSGSGLAVPGPAALPCTNDSQCMTFRCNTQYGKCAMPCASDADCIMGAYCLKGVIPVCLPKNPGQQ